MRGNASLSVRRIAAMAVAIGLHVALCAPLLRPAVFRRDTSRGIVTHDATLDLRFVPLRRSGTPPRPSAVTSAPSKPTVRAYAKPHAATKIAEHHLQVSPAPAEVGEKEPSTTALSLNTAPIESTAPLAGTGDGGFSQQLSAAQHAQEIHGLPGSDRRRATGIQLVDPRSQGIGAVMRSAQRLFGVTSKHCVDVEVWGRMSVEELVARHLTPADVEAANSKYQCNRPLGLSL